VALFASRAFAEVQEPIHFFSSATSPDDLQAKMQRIVASGAAPRKVLHVDDLGTHEDLSAYRAVIFMLGNSTHNLPAFRTAIRSRSEDIRRYFYLHDARITGLLGLHCGNSGTLRRELMRHYPESEATLADASEEVLYLGKIFGLRLLRSLIGAGTFLVNSGRARQLIEGEFGSASPPPIRTSISSDLPCPGRTVGPACRRGSIASGTDDDDLLALMRGVDVAVQPRFPDHGESSGVVRQLLSVGKIPLVTAGTADAELGNLVRSISPTIAPEELATVIQTAASNAGLNPMLAQQYSANAYGRLLDSILLS
jgi:hypothetical protein